MAIKSTKQIVLTVIGIFLMFFGQLFPAPAGLTALDMQIVGIFLGTIFLWLFVSTTWPSILAIVAVAISPIFTFAQALSGSMGSWVTSFVLFSSIVTAALSKSGFLKRFAVWFISRPIAKKNPWALIFLFLLGPLVMGAFMSPIPVYVVFAAIAVEIFNELGYEKGERMPQMLILGILSVSSLSTASTPIAHTVPILAFSLYEKDMGTAIDFTSFTIFGVTVSLIILVVMLLIFRYVFKPDLSKIQNFDASFLNKNKTPVTREEKYSLIVFLCVVVLWLLPGIIKDILPGVYGFLNGLGTAVPAMVGVVALCLIKVDKTPLIDFNESFKTVPWTAVMMVAAAMILGSALTHEDVVVTQYIVDLVAPVTSGLSPTIFVLFVALFTIVFTNFASNTVTVTLIYTMIMPLVLSGTVSGVNPAALACIIGAGACLAQATPPSTAQAAIAAGSGWLKVDVMFRYGFLIGAIEVIVLAFIGYPILAAIM